MPPSQAAETSSVVHRTSSAHGRAHLLKRLNTIYDAFWWIFGPVKLRPVQLLVVSSGCFASGISFCREVNTLREPWNTVVFYFCLRIKATVLLAACSSQVYWPQVLAADGIQSRGCLVPKANSAWRHHVEWRLIELLVLSAPNTTEKKYSNEKSNVETLTQGILFLQKFMCVKFIVLLHICDSLKNLNTHAQGHSVTFNTHTHTHTGCRCVI